YRDRVHVSRFVSPSGRTTLRTLQKRPTTFFASPVSVSESRLLLSKPRECFGQGWLLTVNSGTKVVLSPHLPSDWDRSQSTVIKAPSKARLIVEAGPGSGKTAVACGRIAHLIKELDVSPSNVLLISFTRTAVQELRDRIAAHLGDAATASGVRVSTLD